jgi:hypothetical protein
VQTLPCSCGGLAQGWRRIRGDPTVHGADYCEFAGAVKRAPIACGHDWSAYGRAGAMQFNRASSCLNRYPDRAAIHHHNAHGANDGNNIA